MNRIALFFVCAVSTACLVFAEPTVSDVRIRQDWPWSTKVFVDYRISGTTAPVDIRVEAAYDDGTVGAAAFVRVLKGEVYALRDGVHSFAFKPDSLFPASVRTASGLRLTLTPVASDPTMADALYKIIDLGTGTIENVSVGALLNGGYGAYESQDEMIAAGGAVKPEACIWTGVTNDVKYATDYLVLRKVYAKGVSWTTGAGTSGSPAFRVSLTNDFYAGVFQFTQGQWKKLMGAYPASNFNGEGVRDRRPVEFLAYNAVRGEDLYPKPPAEGSVFAALRNLSGLSCDFPGEFQWEWMALSGTSNLNSGYNTGLASQVVANVDPNFPGRYQHNGGYVGGTTAPDRTCGPENGTAYVGSYAPSKWGFYDCHGNVNEMCLDYYESRTVVKDYGGRINVNAEDPTKTLSGGAPGGRVARGGHWRTGVSYVVSSSTMPLTGGYNNYGFRVFLNVD